MTPTNTTAVTTETSKLDDSQRTPCEVWTRVMGYHRPASSFNSGKQSEFAERVYFEDSSSTA
ncbi:MAG: anaerobic ribonucleoside-triphosphate reductase [Coriobacteriia bacterium]|nr:anaerobic ribonucleoside-triphosphate reductase [Coriobacteriia bacterium]